MKKISEFAEFKKEDYPIPCDLILRPEPNQALPHVHVKIGKNSEVCSISVEESPKILVGKLSLATKEQRILFAWIAGHRFLLAQFYKQEESSEIMLDGIEEVFTKSERLPILTSAHHIRDLSTIGVCLIISTYPIEKYHQSALCFTTADSYVIMTLAGKHVSGDQNLITQPLLQFIDKNRDILKKLIIASEDYYEMNQQLKL